MHGLNEVGCKAHAWPPQQALWNHFAFGGSLIKVSELVQEESMFTRLWESLFSESQQKTGGPHLRAKPGIETLEDRNLMAVTYHGGALLPNVEVQALYYGSDWTYNSTYYNQAAYLDGFLNNVVHGPYMDMLGKAGYGVGHGSFTSGRFDGVNIDKTKFLTDGQLRTDLQTWISAGLLSTPDANRLYVLFVEDNVAVSNGSETSQKNFLGYHGAFAGKDALGHAADIHYAVIPYPGGSIGNGSLSWLSTLGTLTEVTSHELAEAVTDPNVNYKSLGWYDTTNNGEVGDIVVGQTVFLDGYAVQRIADKNDQAMTPAGATAATPVTFVLQTNGYLYKHTSAGWTFLASGIASVSDQGIDNYGRALVDVVTTGGLAYEFHEGGSWTYLWSGAKSAKAGQGVSYLLFTDGSLYEYKDAKGSWTFIDSGITAIDAGTDRTGVNMVDVIFSWGGAYEHSDANGWYYLGSGVKAVSAGQQGISDILFTNGWAYWFNEATGGFSFLGSNVAAVTTGTDQYGNYMIELLYNGGALYEYRVGQGWRYLDSWVASVSKARAGLVDVVFTWGDAYDHDAYGYWHYLTGSVLAAA
jgi:hypothetical protein